jgi:hypothetical protein
MASYLLLYRVLCLLRSSVGLSKYIDQMFTTSRHRVRATATHDKIREFLAWETTELTVTNPIHLPFYLAHLPIRPG